MSTGLEIRTFETNAKTVAFLADGKIALSGSNRSESEKTLKLWDLVTGHRTRDPRVRGTFRGGLVGCCFAGRQDRAVRGSGALELWDLATGHKIRVL